MTIDHRYLDNQKNTFKQNFSKAQLAITRKGFFLVAAMDDMTLRKMIKANGIQPWALSLGKV